MDNQRTTNKVKNLLDQDQLIRQLAKTVGSQEIELKALAEYVRELEIRIDALESKVNKKVI